MYESPKLVSQDGDRMNYRHCVRAHMAEPLHYKHGVFAKCNEPNEQQRPNRESLNILKSERSGFTSIQQKCSHRSLVDSTFYRQTDITKALKMPHIDISCSSFAYMLIGLITHATTSTYAATQMHELLDYFLLPSIKECTYKNFPVL